MPRLVIAGALLAGFLLQSGSAFAGGWTHPRGKGYFKLNEQVIKSGAYFLPSGRKTDITDQSRYTTSLYGEFGLVDRLTLVGYIPFYQRISEDRAPGPTPRRAPGTGSSERGSGCSPTGPRS